MCVSSLSFSILINGTVKGYFDGRKGLRQGDSLSLILFTTVMEVLYDMLELGFRTRASHFIQGVERSYLPTFISQIIYLYSPMGM